MCNDKCAILVDFKDLKVQTGHTSNRAGLLHEQADIIGPRNLIIRTFEELAIRSRLVTTNSHIIPACYKTYIRGVQLGATCFSRGTQRSPTGQQAQHGGSSSTAHHPPAKPAHSRPSANKPSDSKPAAQKYKIKSSTTSQLGSTVTSSSHSKYPSSLEFQNVMITTTNIYWRRCFDGRLRTPVIIRHSCCRATTGDYLRSSDSHMRNDSVLFLTINVHYRLPLEF